MFINTRSTSPYAYVIYHSVSAVGDCGVVGKTYSAITMSYTPGELKTIRYTSGFNLSKNATFSTYPINFADYPPSCASAFPESLPAPTYLESASTLDLVHLKSNYKSSLLSLELINPDNQDPCYPLVEYPSRIQSYDSAWGTCLGLNVWPRGGIQDPPRVLTPAAELAASAPTPVPEKGSFQAPSAMPAPSLEQPVASKTYDPTPFSSSAAPIDDSGSASAPASDQGADTENADNISYQQPSRNHQNDLIIGQAGKLTNAQPATGGNTPKGPDSVVDPNALLQAPTPPPYNSVFALTAPNGAIMSGGIINKDALVISGATLQAGAPAITIANHQLSLNPQASNFVVVIDGQTRSLPPPQPSPDWTFTAAGHVIDGHDGVIEVDGTPIPEGGSAVAVSGTPVRLASSSALVIGSSTIALLPTGGAVNGAVPFSVMSASELTSMLAGGNMTGLGPEGSQKPVAFKGAAGVKKACSGVRLVMAILASWLVGLTIWM